MPVARRHATAAAVPELSAVPDPAVETRRLFSWLELPLSMCLMVATPFLSFYGVLWPYSAFGLVALADPAHVLRAVSSPIGVSNLLSEMVSQAADAKERLADLCIVSIGVEHHDVVALLAPCLPICVRHDRFWINVVWFRTVANINQR